jgi:phage terminase small subunit
MSKNLNIRAQKATQEIFDILGVRPTGAQGENVAHAIEQVIVKALEKSVERSTDAALEVFSADRGMAQKINEEIRLANKALIANLSALR